MDTKELMKYPGVKIVRAKPLTKEQRKVVDRAWAYVLAVEEAHKRASKSTLRFDASIRVTP